MPVPPDPYPDFVPGTLADADKIDQRFKALYDALDPGTVGLDGANIRDGTLTAAELADGTITAAKLAFAVLAVLSVDRKLAAGLNSVPAGSSLLVNHGLGVTARVVVVSANGAGLVATNPGYDIPNATQIRLYNPDGFAYNISWIALG